MSGFQELIVGTSLYSMGDLIISTYDANNGRVILSAPINSASLSNSPSDDCTITNAIATVGWVRKNGGTVKSVNGNTPDANGNVEIEAGEGSVKSVDNISPDGSGNINLGAVTTTKVETAG